MMSDHYSTGEGDERGQGPRVEPPPSPDELDHSVVEPSASGGSERRRTLLLCLSLLVLVLGTFFSALRNDFVRFDDPDYVTANVHVRDGLSWKSVMWAFRSTAAANWHPLTWLSHMLDCQLFGLAPWGHHLTSILLHAVNTILVFLVLERMTCRTWRSFLVAALFGVHPLRVESVAWVAERKDVLSTAFWMLTLWAYWRYVRKADGGGQRAGLRTSDSGHPCSVFRRVSSILCPLSSGCYWLALLFFCLGLLSKPMLVTVPCVLLLLDYWPLDRFKQMNVWSLAWEKAPFFLMAAIVSAVTFMVQKRWGAVSTGWTFAECLENAVVSYCRYLGKLFFPVDLAFFYPYSGQWPVAVVVWAGVALLLVSIVVVTLRPRHPYLLVGWLWFLGTLVPVIGLVPVGQQAMADRYTYVPSVGIFLLLVWAVAELTGRWRWKIFGSALVATVVLVTCVVLSNRQIGYWKENETLFRHAIAVTRNNYLAYDNLGTALSEKGKIDEAMVQYREAVRIKPEWAEAHNNLGGALENKGQLAEALNQFVESIKLKPGLAAAHYNLANALAETGRLEDAISELQKAVKLKPDYTDARYNLGNALSSAGRLEEATTQYLEILKLDPNYAEAHYNLGITLCGQGRLDEGIIQFQEFLKQRPGSADAHRNLGAILDKEGRLEEAISHLVRALQLNPADAKAHCQLGAALAKQGRRQQAISEFRRALNLKPDYVEARNDLDAALRLEKDSERPAGPANP
jgi:tetratricopeptide (TPR) repeat protein